MALTKLEADEYQQLVHRHHELVDAGEQWLAERKQNFQAMNDRLDAIEAKTNRPTLFGGAVGGSPDDVIDLEEVREAQERAVRNRTQRKAFHSFIRKGLTSMGRAAREAMVPTEAGNQGWNYKSLDLKALNLTDDTLGGFFVLPEIVTDEIIRKVVLVSPIRDIAMRRQTSSNSLKIPVMNAQTSAAWVSETGTRSPSSNPNIGMKDIPTHEMYALVLYSRQMLEDAYFDIEKELQYQYGKQFAKLEGAAFVSGNGVGQPLGFLNDPNIVTYTTATSATLTADDLIGAFYNYPEFDFYEPNATWVLNRKTLGTIRDFKDSQGNFLWVPGVGSNGIPGSGVALGVPSTILGRPYVLAPDMPNIAASATALAFGDFEAGYSIVDRTQIAVQRLEELYATSAQVGLLAYKRVGGQTVLSEAIHSITIHS